VERDVISALGEELGRELDEARGNHAGVGRARAAFIAGAEPRFRRSRKLAPRAYAAGATLLAAAAVVLVLWIRSLHGQAPAHEETIAKAPLTFSGESGTLLVANAELPLAFSDGTRVVLEKQARARVTDVDHWGARVILESGTLHASVVHTGTARWNVDAGPFEVHVTGTKFAVTWEPATQSIDVKLEEGSVIVSGCNPPQTVRGGESLHLDCRATTATTPPATTATTATTATPTTATPTTTTPTTTATATATPTEPAIADLFAQADEARYAGRLDDAKAALLAVRRRAPGSEKSASAAFELGRLAFDGKNDYAQAALWFDTYLRERPQGTLAREALGRSMEAQDRAGDAELAQRAATTYLTRYPTGPHAALARRLAGGHQLDKGDLP